MLTKQLRKLEADGIIHREIFTEKGRAIFPIIESMSTWGEAHMKTSVL